MQRYLSQLIEDLEVIAVKPPEAPWTETPPHLAHDPVIAELALVPSGPLLKLQSFQVTLTIK